MKKKYRVFAALIIVVIVCFVFYKLVSSNHSIVSQSFQEIAQIYIEKSGNKGYDMPITIQGENAVILFDTLKNTRAKRETRRQNDTMEFDPPYIITIVYQNGQSDKINCMPESTKWFRWYENNKYLITNGNDAIVKLIEEKLIIE